MKETGAWLSAYLQSKLKHKLAQENKQIENEWDLALSTEVVKQKLFDSNFDEEVSFRPVSVRDPRQQKREEEIKNKSHWLQLKQDLQQGLSPTVQQYFEWEDLIPSITEPDVSRKFHKREVLDGAESVL